MTERYLRFCQLRPRAVLLALVLLSALLALGTYGRLSFSAERESLFRATSKERGQREEFERRFGRWNELVLVVDGATPARREAAVLALASSMKKSRIFNDVRASLEFPRLRREALYFLSVADLQKLDKTLQERSDLLSTLARDGWYSFLASRAGSRVSDQGEDDDRFTRAWKASVEGRGTRALEPLFPSLQPPARAFFTDGESRHLIFFRSDDPLAALEASQGFQARIDFPGRVVMLGQPLLQAQEEAETVRDAVVSTILSIVFVQLLLIAGFRETARPRLAFLSLAFGLVWSLAWAAIAVSVLNIITVNFLSITVGLGIDFSIHYLARYSEERPRMSSLEAMLITWRTTGWEIFVGAVATSLAFAALLLTDFQAVKELGLITSVAIILCFLSVVLVLPPLLFWHEAGREFAPLNVTTMPWLSDLERWLRANPRRSLTIGLVVVGVLGIFGNRVTFDYNLLNLQSGSFESVIYERESGFSTLAAFVVAKSPAEALEVKARLEKLDSVSRVTTAADLFPPDLEAKEALVRGIVARARALPLPSYDAAAVPDWARLRALTGKVDTLVERPDWVRTLSELGPGPVEAVWRQMQAHLKAELSRMVGELRAHETSLNLTTWRAGFPDLERYSNADGRTLVRVQAKKSLWERAPLERFTDEVQSVAPDALGPPFLIRRYLEQMRQSYFDAVRYAIVAIVLLLFGYFRRWLPTMIALVPKLVGTLGMLGAMGLCGISFNPANCMAMPLTLGIGLVFGIHAVHRCLEHPDELLVEGSTGKSISLAAWTDIVSFGTMLVATNPGIFSIGFVMAVGVGANLLATYLLVPPLVVLFRDGLLKK